MYLIKNLYNLARFVGSIFLLVKIRRKTDMILDYVILNDIAFYLKHNFDDTKANELNFNRVQSLLNKSSNAKRVYEMIFLKLNMIDTSFELLTAELKLVKCLKQPMNYNVDFFEEKMQEITLDLEKYINYYFKNKSEISYMTRYLKSI